MLPKPITIVTSESSSTCFVRSTEEFAYGTGHVVTTQTPAQVKDIHIAWKLIPVDSSKSVILVNGVSTMEREGRGGFKIKNLFLSTHAKFLEIYSFYSCRFHGFKELLFHLQKKGVDLMTLEISHVATVNLK